MGENDGRKGGRQGVINKTNAWKIIGFDCAEEKVEECLTIFWWEHDLKWWEDGEVPGR